MVVVIVHGRRRLFLFLRKSLNGISLHGISFLLIASDRNSIFSDRNSIFSDRKSIFSARIPSETHQKNWNSYQKNWNSNQKLIRRNEIPCREIPLKNKFREEILARAFLARAS
jgi:hypothetical protein